MQMGRCLVYMDHCGNDIRRHTFPLAPHRLFQRLDLHFFAFLGDIAPSWLVASTTILTVFQSAYSISSTKQSSCHICSSVCRDIIILSVRFVDVVDRVRVRYYFVVHLR